MKIIANNSCQISRSFKLSKAIFLSCALLAACSSSDTSTNSEPALPSNDCNNAADRSALQRVDYGANQNQPLVNIVADCGNECASNPNAECLEGCIGRATNSAVSGACTSCYSRATLCSMSHCSQACAQSQTSAGCMQCRTGQNDAQQNCAADFEVCSAISPADRIQSRIDDIVAADQQLPLNTPHAAIDNLPAPLKRYWSTVLGSQHHSDIRGVSMQIEGRLKLPGKEQWMPIEGQQYISAIRPAFLWNVRLTAGGTAWFDVKDTYQGCVGQIFSSPFSLYPNLFQYNLPPLNTTQLARWSGLLALVPAALINNPHVTWQAIDDYTAEAQVEDCGLTIKHRFFFNEAGQLVRSDSDDRYEIYPGTGYVKTGSIMYRINYATVDGISIPTESNVIRVEEGNKEVEFLQEKFTDIRFHR